jgi:D-aminoacyl-tRNA deacylase
MRVVIQRVSEASVSIDGRVHGVVGKGMLLLLGIEDADNSEDAAWLCSKISQLRIFSDDLGKMNLSIREAGGNFLVISQFTLHASYKKGNRPSFIRAANPDKAISLYEEFIAVLRSTSGCMVETGIFGAMMQVSLVNDGPVTLIFDSRNRE